MSPLFINVLFFFLFRPVWVSENNYLPNAERAASEVRGLEDPGLSVSLGVRILAIWAGGASPMGSISISDWLVLCACSRRPDASILLHNRGKTELQE